MGCWWERLSLADASCAAIFETKISRITLYIYIYIYVYAYTYIYIYIEREREILQGTRCGHF